MPVDSAIVPAARVLTLGCPECEARRETPVSGVATCRSCLTRYTAVVFTPPQEEGPVVQSSTSGAACAQHARNLAIGSCARCGSFMCELCRIDLDGQQICPTCFDRVQADSSSTNKYNYSSIGFLISLAGIPMMILGTLIGPVAIYFCLRGIFRTANRTDDVAGVSVTGILGILLGLFETVVGTIIFVALLVRR